MFTTLLECKPNRPRSPFGMAASVVTHGLVLFVAVRATLHATQPAANPAQKIAFIVPKPAPLPPKHTEQLTAPVHKAFQTLTAPVNIPNVTVVRSTHTLFESAVRAALPHMRFLPPEVAGPKVRQLVHLPFVFNIVK